MRILFVTHHFLGFNTAELYRKLAASGDVELLVVVPAQSPGIAATDTTYQVDTARFRNSETYLEGFVPEDLKRVMRRFKPDIIQCMSEAFSSYVLQVAWISLSACPRAKILFYAFENMPISRSLRSRIKLKPAWARLAGGAASSKGAVDSLRHAGFPAAKPIRVIPFGIGSHAFLPMDRAAVRQELGLRPGKIVGYVGRLISQKGLSTLLAVVAKLPEEVSCVFMGAGPLRPEIELWSTLPPLKSRIIMVDQLEPAMVAKYMNAMDVLVLPSVKTPTWKEQYGRVLVEAMACGTPVVGSDSGAIPEVIGDAGAVVAEYDVDGFVGEIAHLLNDSAHWKTMSERALERSAAFTDTAMCADLLQFYRDILTKSHAKS